VGQNHERIDTAPVIVNRGNQAILVPAHIENDHIPPAFDSNLVRMGKLVADRDGPGRSRLMIPETSIESKPDRGWCACNIEMSSCKAGREGSHAEGLVDIDVVRWTISDHNPY